MDFAVRVGAGEPVVGVQQKRAVGAAKTRREGVVVRARAEVALVIRKIKHRHAVRVKHRVPHLHRLAGNDPDARAVDAKFRVRRVVRGDERVVGVIHPVAGIARQVVAAGEHRPFARAELRALHLARLEIVADVLAHPELVGGLDPHMAVRHHLARLLVHRRGIGGQRRAAVFDVDAVRARGRAGGRVVIHQALHRAGNDCAQRVHLPGNVRLLRRRGNQGKRQQKQRDGGKRFHQARPVKQNGNPAPSGFETGKF